MISLEDKTKILNKLETLAARPVQNHLEIEWRQAGYSEEVIKICLASKLVRDSLEQDNEITICQSA